MALYGIKKAAFVPRETEPQTPLIPMKALHRYTIGDFATCDDPDAIKIECDLLSLLEMRA